MAVHSRRQCRRLIFPKRVRCHGENRYTVRVLMTAEAYGSRRLVSIHDRHQMCIRDRANHLRLYPSDIYFLESSLRKVIINTEHEQFEIYATMAELEARLGGTFFRCHRGYLVNLGKVRSYSRNTIQLTNGSCLILSKSKYAEFVDRYMRYLGMNDGPGGS